MSSTARANTSDPAGATAAGPRRWWGLVAISLGVALIIVDSTIVNVAIPSIVDDLHITSSDAQWVQETYTLVFAALLLLAGRTGDRLGRRRVFLTGTAVFTAASLAAATATGGPALIGARLVQGAGGAMMLPTSLALINAGFRGRQRAQAFAVWGSTIGGTAALGPLLGGYLTTHLSWRWAFAINLPLGALVAAGVLVFVTESRSERAERGVDLAGAALSVLGFTGIVFALIEGRTYGWWAPLKPFPLLGRHLSPVPVALAGGLACLVAFVVVERHRNRHGRTALLDLRLFSIPSFRNGNIVAGIVSLGEFGILFSLPLWFQNVLGYSAFDAGLALLPLAVGSFAASGLSAVLAPRIGTLNLVIAGIACELVGVAGIGLVLSPHGNGWHVTPFLLVYGIGVGWATARITGIVLTDVPVTQSGQGSGIQSTTRQIGSALGIALLGTVLFTTLSSDLTHALRTEGLPPARAHAIATAVQRSGGTGIRPLLDRSATRTAGQRAQESFTSATSLAAYTAAGALTLGLLSALRLKATLPRTAADPTLPNTAAPPP
ncbi:DHA2 family efflux MFS transporter permease subunit [Kitasatospora sp. NPDC085464]|uniref:DHA2 family efflux MFS transporter permease subunit n=1 Tax=Kitasatospora sp. NPDC085464 TaxID=3364063 RepID=UPI0037CA943A